MLNSRWTRLNVYRCWSDIHGRYHYIAALDEKDAERAFESVTRLKSDYTVLYATFDNFAVTEEAQAQSELFPNQVLK